MGRGWGMKHFISLDIISNSPRGGSGQGCGFTPLFYPEEEVKEEEAGVGATADGAFGVFTQSSNFNEYRI